MATRNEDRRDDVELAETGSAYHVLSGPFPKEPPSEAAISKWKHLFWRITAVVSFVLALIVIISLSIAYDKRGIISSPPTPPVTSPLAFCPILYPSLQSLLEKRLNGTYPRNPLNECGSSSGVTEVLINGSTTLQYLNIFGAPKNLSVAIIGGGISGLTAALVLNRRGYDVTILEAQDRLGGRILTHTFSDNSKAELGAMRLDKDNHTVALYLIQNLLNLSITSFNQKGIDELNYILGKNFKSSELPARASELGFNLRPQFNLSPDDLSEMILAPIVEFIQTCPQYKELLFGVLGDLSQSQLLYDAGLNLDENNYMTILGNTQSYVNRVSAFEYYMDHFHFVGNPQFVTVDGKMETLINRLAQHLQDNGVKIYLKTRVRSITFNEELNNYDICAGDQTWHRFSGVIVTAAAPIVNQIAFSPELSLCKQVAYNVIEYDQSTKVALKFNESFWDTPSVKRWGSKSITSTHGHVIYYLNDSVAMSYTWGKEADVMGALSPDEQVRNVLVSLANLYNMSVEQVRSYYTGENASMTWRNNDIAGGAFVLYAPTNYLDVECGVIREDLSLSGIKSSLRFAGEHKAPEGHAWIEFGLRSAVQEANFLDLALQEKNLGQAFDYDYIVIGGGPMGLAAAYQLAKLQPDASIAVFEQFTFFNQKGSSGDYVRMFRTMYTDEYLMKLATQSVAFWKDLETVGNRTLIEMSGLLYFGNPNYTTGPEGNLTGPLQYMSKYNLSYEILNSTQMETRYAMKDLPKHYIGIFAPDNGIIDVLGVQQVLYALAENLGVALVPNQEVTKLKISDEGAVVKTLNGDFTAKKLILTPGAYVNHLTESLGFTFNVSIWEMVYAYYAMEPNITVPAQWFQFEEPSPDADSNLFYGFPPVPWSPPGYTRLAVDYATNVITDPKDRNPIASEYDLNITSRWTREHLLGTNDTATMINVCLMTNVIDNNFVLDFGPPQYLGKNADKVAIYFAGWGMKFVPLIGQILAELTVFGNTSYDISNFKSDRPGVLNKY